MVKVDEFYFDSRDKRTKIHAVRWTPNTEIKCVLQIVHGMSEYIERYDEFARFMAAEGVLVVGCDHLGHGKTANSEEELGYFCENDAATVVVRDVHRLKKLVQEENIGKPYFLLGHSMGSYITREYMFRYSKGIDGILLTGSDWKPDFQGNLCKFMSKLLAVFYGWKHKSPMLNHLAFDRNSKKITNRRTENDWICANPEVVDKYNADDKCGFIFTLNGFYTLGQFAVDCNKKENLAKIRKDLSVYLLSGAKDPAGGYGSYVEKIQKAFLAAGMTDVKMKLYENDRHEILNEKDRFAVYEDVLKFVLDQTARQKK